MSRQLLIFLVSLMFVVTPQIVLGEWYELVSSVEGDTHFIDVETIKVRGNFRYAWLMSDLIEPTPYGDLSSKIYYKMDCEIDRVMALSASFHTGPLGKGSISTSQSVEEPKWNFVSPDSVIGGIRKFVCNY